MTLGAALRKYRKQRKLVQKELAAKIGISLKHYAMIERCKAYPSHTVLQKIFEVTTVRVRFSVRRDRVSEATAKYLIRLKTKRGSQEIRQTSFEVVNPPG